MAEVGVLEAKTHFSQLVERVKRGEIITITNRGKPVARLEPIVDRAEALAAADRLRDRAEQLGAGITHEEIRAWINEGRR